MRIEINKLKSKMVTARLSEKDFISISKIAQNENASIAEVVRAIIIAYLKEQK